MHTLRQYPLHHLLQELTVMATTTSTGDAENPNSSSSPSSSSSTGTVSTTNLIEHSTTLIAGILGAVGVVVVMLIIATVVILAVMKMRFRARRHQLKMHEKVNSLTGTI